jgi:hypothetical protein
MKKEAVSKRQLKVDFKKKSRGVLDYLQNINHKLSMKINSRPFRGGCKIKFNNITT